MFGFTKRESAAKRFARLSLTFVIGAAAGVAVGLLYAPKTGKKMQKDLKNGFDKVRDVVEDSAENVVSGIRGASNSVQGFVKKVANS